MLSASPPFALISPACAVPLVQVRFREDRPPPLSCCVCHKAFVLYGDYWKHFGGGGGSRLGGQYREVDSFTLVGDNCANTTETNVEKKCSVVHAGWASTYGRLTSWVRSLSIYSTIAGLYD